MEKSGEKLRRSEQLREIIEERIATGDYRPGMRLDETELASEFGVSRTPIREALIQLASEGLVDMRPRRSAVVTAITPQRLYEMFEVMAELEAACVRLAILRMTGDELTDLIQVHRACGDENHRKDPDAYYRMNEQFHLTIYKGSHNGFLIEEASSLFRRLRPYRRLQLRVKGRLDTSFEEHSAIVEAIRAGNCDLAAEHLRKHITVQGERFFYLIRMIEEGSYAGEGDEASPPKMA